jgi:hypothetical protein
MTRSKPSDSRLAGIFESYVVSREAVVHYHLDVFNDTLPSWPL